MSNLNRSAFQGHPFHLVSPSPWPIFTCISLLILTTSGVLTMHGFSSAGNWLLCAFALLVSSMFFWFRDVISEGTYLGNHSLAVQRGLNMGVALFIVSEALFFLAIFWAYFHSALSPTAEVGAQWPPMGIEAINAFELPLLNTILLLGSGIIIAFSQHPFVQGMLQGIVFLVWVLFTGISEAVWEYLTEEELEQRAAIERTRPIAEWYAQEIAAGRSPGHFSPSREEEARIAQEAEAQRAREAEAQRASQEEAENNSGNSNNGSGNSNSGN